MGGEEVKTQHELRQDEQGSAILLRQEHHEESPREALHVQV